MKTYFTLFIFMAINITSPVYGNYTTLNNDLNSYAPPEYFAKNLSIELETSKEIFQSQQRIDDRLITLITKLKADQEKKLYHPGNLPFLTNLTFDEYSRLKTISKDSNAVLKQIQDKLILKEIEAMAAFRNPSILSAQSKIAAEIQSFNQVMALDENLRQYTAFSNALNLKTGPLKMKEATRLKYPYPGISALKGQIVNLQVKILTQKLDITRNQVITDMRKAFWQLVFIDTSKTITAETLEALDRLKNVATTLYKSGKVSFQDVIKINIKIAVLKENLVTLGTQRTNVEIKILELLNIPDQKNLGKPQLVNFYKKIETPDAIYLIAKDHRPELKRIRATITKTEKMVQMAEAMIQSPYSLNLSLNENKAVKTVGSDAEQMSFPEKTMAAMKNGLPAGAWYGINDPWLKGTKKKLNSLKQSLISAENTTKRMVQEAWFKVDKSHRERLLYEMQILDLSTSALKVSTREYESGAIPFSQAIGSYTDWLKIRLTIAKKQMDLKTGISTLEQLTGISF